MWFNRSTSTHPPSTPKSRKLHKIRQDIRNIIKYNIHATSFSIIRVYNTIGRSSWKLSTFEGSRRRSRGIGRTQQTGPEPGGRVLDAGVTKPCQLGLVGRRNRTGWRSSRLDTGLGAGTYGTGRTTPAADAADSNHVFRTSHPCASRGQRQRPPDQSLVAGPEETAKSCGFETEEHVQRSASQE